MADRLCVGVVVGAHGIKGQVRIKSFTADPADLTRYGPLLTETGQEWRLRNAAVGTKGIITAGISGVEDRNQAEAAKGVKLYLRRDALPPPEEDEYYIADLIGLTAQSPGGEILGKVKAAFNFGAGDILEIACAEGDVLVPFTRRVVPVVDMAAGRVTIDLPEDSEDEDGD
jgi:16S rRNA processing protein RimM